MYFATNNNMIITYRDTIKIHFTIIDRYMWYSCLDFLKGTFSSISNSMYVQGITQLFLATNLLKLQISNLTEPFSSFAVI